MRALEEGVVEAELGILPGRGSRKALVRKAERGAPQASHRVDVGFPVVVEDADSLTPRYDQRAPLGKRLGIGLRVKMKLDVTMRRRVRSDFIHGLYLSVISWAARKSPPRFSIENQQVLRLHHC